MALVEVDYLLPTHLFPGENPAAWYAPVHYAATVLDRVFPGWAERVEVTTLDLSSLTRCILGQACRNQESWWNRLWWSNPRGAYGIGIARLERESIPSGVFWCRAAQEAWVLEIARRVCHSAVKAGA